MAQMIDTEGEEIPSDENGSKYFDLHVTSSFGDNAPELALNIPMYFEDAYGSTYSSAGVLVVNLESVFDEYLNDFKSIDDGEGLNDIVLLLRKYADLFESAKNK